MARQPLDLSTMLGAQVSNDQLEKILSYIEIGKEEGAKVLTGGLRVDPDGDLPADSLRRQQRDADLPHYQNTKNLVVSHSPKALGFF